MKAYLLNDYGYEHNEIFAVVLGDENIDMKSLKEEFEKYVKFKPTDRFDDNIDLACSEKRGKKVNKALGKLFNDGYVNESHQEVLYDVGLFLTGFANWLVKNKGFTKVDFEYCGYRYFG